MSPIGHVAASSLISAVFAFFTRSVSGTAVCFLSGIFLDVDHILDYWIAKKKVFFTYKQLENFCGGEKAGKLYLIFHSYEFLILLWLSIVFFKANIVWLGLAVGVTAHLLLDLTANPLRPWVYSLGYRFRHGFSKYYVFPKDYYEGMK